ncbi:DUF1810 domain-containing protein [Novosphingobium sp. G106]|uniref:DUF1810 domain-containing protein n=1 Tax=Novosphingobium sp. G106 TaxID=2849500 RepID=UPI001C2D856E|nr:DUF1810 domain-containing protein [Novosphingobium sp. G106]MBV1690755.1 DUF1810 domain-containing protein [Novosphingobium sp. G106]
MDPLERFVAAQEQVYPRALAELRAGDKRSHWMWFIFPQIAGLGHSAMAQRYAIADRAEAEAYIAHSLLGPRLADCTDALLGWSGRRTAEAILGPVDALKLRSSMTLFEATGGAPHFAQTLDAFCAGERDPETIARL